MKIQLTQTEIEDFYRLHTHLMLYVNKRKKVLNDVTSIENLGVIGAENVMKIREKLIKDNNRWQTGEITVMFSPYIRTDNLKDLFAKPMDSTKVEKFESIKVGN